MTLVRFVRFVLVGGFATGIQYVVLIALVQSFQIGAVLASGVGFAVSAFANYILNYYFTFGSREKHLKALSKFAVLASIGLVLNSGIMSLLVHNGVFYILAQVVATVTVLLWNFVGNSLWTFRKLPQSKKGKMESAHG